MQYEEYSQLETLSYLLYDGTMKRIKQRTACMSE